MIKAEITFTKVAISLILASITIMLNQGIFMSRIQPSDIIFLIVFIPTIIKFISEKRQIYLSPFIKPMAIYAFMAMLSIFISVNTKTTFIEFVGLSYLIILFLFWINIVDTKELLKYAVLCWVIISGVVSILGLVGIVLAYGFNINNIFVTFFKEHPYINNLYRVHSTFFKNEKFLSSYLLISIPLVLSLAFYERRRKKELLLFTLIALFLVNVFFTYSRSIVGILVAIYIVVFRNPSILTYREKWVIKALKGFGIALILIVWITVILVSHIQFLGISSKTRTLSELPAGVKEPYYYRPDIGIKETEFNIKYNYSYYSFLKKYAWKIFIQHPFRGIGNGAFIDQMRIYDIKGEVPKGYLLFDPHSVFLGSLAELGIFGFLALMYLWLVIILTLRKKLLESSAKGYNFHLLLAFYAATLGFFIQGSDLDIMNFRFLWLLFGFGAIIMRLQHVKKP